MSYMYSVTYTFISIFYSRRSIIVSWLCFCPRSDCGIQIIGMSATLPNLSLLARWLQADLYHTDYRPVPLTEMVKIGPHVYDKHMQQLRKMDDILVFKGDEEQIIPLCLETIYIGTELLKTL